MVRQISETEYKGIADYIRIFKRRKKAFLISFTLVFLSFLLLAILLPPVYRSTATILIEEQEIPPDLVRTTVTGYVEERLQAITQQIMSRPRLLEVINRFNLYADLREKLTIDEIIEKMRDSIELETISIEVPNPREKAATIAFTLSYEGKEPNTVQQVTNYLASLYLEENLKNRETKAKETTQFLEAQIDMLKKHIEELDKKIAEFKEKHLTELPELTQLNLQNLRRLSDEIARLDDQIAMLQERKIYLEGQLATINPYLPIISETGERILTPEKRLELLKNQYISAIATLSPKHPDVLKLKKEIESLEKEVKVRNELQNDIKRLENLKSQLASLKERLSDKHPDIKRLKREIAELEKKIEKSSNELKTTIVKEPDNPSYINLSTQIASTEMEIENLKKQREELRKKLEDYQRRLERMPEVEKEYQSLLRDKTNAEIKYRELMDKLMEAKVAERLESSQKGERFTIIDPPQYPEEPCKPNRLAIILIGFILSLGTGIAAVSIAEYIDHSVKGVKDIASITSIPVIGILPIIETEEDIAAKKKIKLVYIAGALLLMIICLVFVHFYFIKLDILWYKIW
ncbi:MAG: lipopolysaccharide biosynthesis protein [Candidatus Desulfofervidus auxilii]|nr:lipopolysaccharide biosynthesis protein [Candidatus Desulfofervidus auxilii]